MVMMLTQAQLDYLRGVDVVEIGRRYGLHGLKEVQDGGLPERALYLAMKGSIKDGEVLKGILRRVPLWERVKRYLELFLDTGLDRAVVYSSFVSCGRYSFLKTLPEGFERMTLLKKGAENGVSVYKLKHYKIGGRVFRDMVYPRWQEFVDLIEEGVRLRLKTSYKRKNVLLAVKDWGELGDVLLKRLNYWL